MPAGKRYLDFITGIGVNALGHAHPRLIKVIREQAGRMLHTSNLYYHAYQGPLAERLAKASGLQRTFFCNSGAESMEGALKMVRAHGHKINPEKFEIVALHNSFHGRTLGALSITGQEKYRQDFEPLLPGARFVPPNDEVALEQVVSERTAGIVIEWIQGEGGIFPDVAEYVAQSARTGGPLRCAAGLRRNPVRRRPHRQVLRLSAFRSRRNARHHGGGQTTGLRHSHGRRSWPMNAPPSPSAPACTAPPSAADRWLAASRSSSWIFSTSCCRTSTKWAAISAPSSKNCRSSSLSSMKSAARV